MADTLALSDAETMSVRSDETAELLTSGSRQREVTVVRMLSVFDGQRTRLVLNCPSCGEQVPFPGATRSGLAMAECDRCDSYFDFSVCDVYYHDGAHDRPVAQQRRA